MEVELEGLWSEKVYRGPKYDMSIDKTGRYILNVPQQDKQACPYRLNAGLPCLRRPKYMDHQSLGEEESVAGLHEQEPS